MPLGAHKATLFGAAGVSTGDVVLLGSSTVSDSSGVTFSGLMTSTYGEYIFKLYNIHADTNTAEFGFQCNATDTADFDDLLITSTHFDADHREDGAGGSLQYNTGKDQAQGTAFQTITSENDSTSDSSAAGELHIFNPASTTYVKHFYSRMSTVTLLGGNANPLHYDSFCAGYFNDTTAIDDIQFKAAAGTFDGTIKMWGVK
jgi:hypothetical protein